MKVVVCSDNHGLIAPLKEILEDYKDADAFLHCGDSELPPNLMAPFHVVTGNNDYDHEYPESLVVEVSGVRFLIIHGHQFYMNRTQALAKEAKKRNCDVVCYGHTHVYDVKEVDGILCVNPGSLRYNRDQTPPCYAVIERIDGNLIVTRHLTP